MLSLLRQFVAFLYSRFPLGPLEPLALRFLTGRWPIRKRFDQRRQGFVFVLNRERVVLEVSELCRLKIAGALGIEPEKVEARLDTVKGKLVPTFEVHDPPEGLDPDLVRETMAGVYARMKLEMDQRVADLGSRRRD